ncbi:hypothetical protein SDC9_206209 [bioreactor metagenome]|uniref:Uncharacterized protein n=1 Tax=bioreactor metagenome TaxID=1076179 RepID=A0A645JDL9_9ZZZZ
MNPICDMIVTREIKTIMLCTSNVAVITPRSPNPILRRMNINKNFENVSTSVR